MENIMQMLNQKEAAPFTGTVKRWFAMRGFGFVQRDDGQRDIFLHISQLPDGRETLSRGSVSSSCRRQTSATAGCVQWLFG
jgi:cold shock CspA family protein